MTTATRTRRPASAAQKEAAQARRVALFEQLDEYKAGLNEDLVALAKVMIWSEKYSSNNATLIVMQAPDATDVRGFRAWQDAGRQVRKGSSGIAIIAPSGHTEATPARDGKPAEKEQHYFRLAYVFDVSQTDPKEV